MRWFSIVTPVYDPPADVLRETIESVLRQTNPNWELILVDDDSPSAHVRPVLAEAAAGDSRIRVIERPHNGGIVAASNDGLAVATGDFVVLLDHDDTLVPAALEMVDLYADRHPEMDYAYSDEDLIAPDGRYVAPFYKPDWSPERLRSQNYCTHLSVFSADLLRRIDGFRDGFDGSQDYDIILRATELAREIVHIPYVLYHWRQIATSVAAGDPGVKPYAYEAGRRAVQEHCDRIGVDAVVDSGQHPGNYRVRRRVVGEPTVSVVIATCGGVGTVWGIERCHVVEAVRSVVAATSRSVQFVIVADASTPAAAVDSIRRVAGSNPVEVLEVESSTARGERLDLGAIRATGEHLLFLHDDIEVKTPEFLDDLLALSQDPTVGAVGCKQVLSDGRMQHAGYVHNDHPRATMHGRAAYETGMGGMLVVQREVMSVADSCLMIRRSRFFEVGGFSPTLSVHADVDLCLKLRHAGLARIWTPHVELYHFEHGSADDPATAGEDERLHQRWNHQLSDDPYFNPNLQPGRSDWIERGLR